MRLEAIGLGYGYPGHPIGRDVHLAVGAGEVRLDGRSLSNHSRAEIARKVAYVPQAQSSQFAYTVLEMALMGRTAHLGPFARPTVADLGAARDALQTMGILNLAGAEYTRISGGQRQLTLIARALAQASSLLVMDEPTASLDFGNQAVVLRQVRRLRHSGLGIVLSTHDPDHAFACATAVALLHQGGLVATGPPATVLTPARLGAVYGVAVTVERLPGGRTICAPDLDS